MKTITKSIHRFSENTVSSRGQRAGRSSFPLRRSFLKCGTTCAWAILLVAVIGGLTACVERPKGQALVTPPVEQTQRRVEKSAMSQKEAQAIKREALNQLQPLIRRFDRKKKAYEISERLYLEKLYCWTLTFSMLEVRSTPGTFAGDVPEHEIFPFSDYAEAAESLLGDITVYLDRFAADSDPEFEMLVSKKNEAGAAVLLPFPGTESRLQDAIAAMRTAEFKAVVNESNTELAELGKIGGKQVVEIVGTAAGKAINLINTFLNSTSK